MTPTPSDFEAIDTVISQLYTLGHKDVAEALERIRTQAKNALVLIEMRNNVPAMPPVVASYIDVLTDQT